MAGISLYDAYKKHVWEKHNHVHDSELDIADIFVEKFISNEFYATGAIPGEYSIKYIDIEFWKTFKTMLSIGIVVEGMLFDIIHDRIIRIEFGIRKIVYERIVVYEEPYKKLDQSDSLKKNASGRKPDKDKWEITVAEAFRIHFENGFPRSRAEFVKQIEEAVFALGSTDPLGHETLVKLVRRIYDRCGL